MSMDGKIDYLGYTVEELIESKSAISETRYPENYANLCNAIEMLKPAQEDGAPASDAKPGPVDSSFEISRPLYRWYFWVVLSMVLITDFMALPSLYSGESGLSTFMLLAVTAGVRLKLAILWTLLAKKGPFENLVYIWGGLMMASGILGLLSFVAAEDPTPISQYINKGIFIVFGLSLVAPLSWYVRRPVTPNESQNHQLPDR